MEERVTRRQSDVLLPCFAMLLGVSNDLRDDQAAAVTMLLQAGKTIKEIVKFAELDNRGVTHVARTLDLEPASDVQRRAKQLYASAEGLTFQEIAKLLATQGFTADDDAPMHHLTVASWVKNYGWAWGGASDGDYAPERAAAAPARSKYTMRMSKAVDAQINTASGIAAAATAAWKLLSSDKTHIVQLAIIQGAAAVGVTDLAAVKKALFDAHGDDIRNAKAI